MRLRHACVLLFLGLAMITGHLSGARWRLPLVASLLAGHPVTRWLRQWGCGAPADALLDWSLGALVEDAAAKLGEAGGALHPVVLIPPLTGVQLELEVEKTDCLPFWLCHRHFGWTLAWVNWRMLLPGWFSCFVDRLSIHCDEGGGGCRSMQGVQVRPRSGVHSVMSVDDDGLFVLYARLVKALQVLGWEAEHDLVAHTYDFRYGPEQYAAVGGSFERLKAEVEGVVQRTGQPAIVCGLSMGPTYLGYFLNHYVDVAWTQRHLRGLVSLSGFWGGTPMAILGMLSADWGGVPIFGSSNFKRLLRSLPVLSWLLPAPAVFGSAPLVRNTATGRDYDAASVGQLLQDASALQAARVWRRVKDGIHIRPFNLTTYCLYGYGVPTASTMTYASADFSDAPEVATVDGDGTVPLESLRECARWREQQAAPVHEVAFEGLQHADILRDPHGFAATLDAIAALHGSGDAPAAAAT